MRHTGIWMLTAVLACAPLVSCTNIKDTDTRTKTEGTLAGTGVGAVAGAVVGYLIGGKRGIAAGATIGAAIGGLTGYGIGNHVANQKARYAKMEDWLNDCLAQLEKTRREVEESNERLREDIARLDTETRDLEAAYRSKQADRSALNAEAERLRQRIEETDTLIRNGESEIALQNAVVREAREGGDAERADRLEDEVQALRGQVDTLKDRSAQLAVMSHRMKG